MIIYIHFSLSTMTLGEKSCVVLPLVSGTWTTRYYMLFSFWAPLYLYSVTPKLSFFGKNSSFMSTCNVVGDTFIKYYIHWFTNVVIVRFQYSFTEMFPHLYWSTIFYMCLSEIDRWSIH
jgi:hypothetical protein